MSNDTTTTEITNTLTALELTKATRSADHIRAGRASSGVQILDMSILEMLESSNPAEVRKGLELVASQVKLTDSGRAYEARLTAAKAAEEQATAPTHVVEEVLSSTAEDTFAQEIKLLEDTFPTWEERHEFKLLCEALNPEVPEVLIASIEKALALRESQIGTIYRTMLHHTGRFDRRWWDARLSESGKRRLHKFLQLQRTDQLDKFFDEALTGLFDEMTELFPKLQEEVPAGSLKTARQPKPLDPEFFGDPEERAAIILFIKELIGDHDLEKLLAWVPADVAERARLIERSITETELLMEIDQISIGKLARTKKHLREAEREMRDHQPTRHRPRNPGSAARKQKGGPKAPKPKGPQKGGADLSAEEKRQIMRNRPNAQGVPGEAPIRGRAVAGAGKGSKEKARKK